MGFHNIPPLFLEPFLLQRLVTQSIDRACRSNACRHSIWTDRCRIRGGAEIPRSPQLTSRHRCEDHPDLRTSMPWPDTDRNGRDPVPLRFDGDQPRPVTTRRQEMLNPAPYHTGVTPDTL